ncbi:hypothetical protein PIB30_036109 [Stylosanthes scabra]|uniref:Uncharacterized protein n=1 Tax=Stylosanthes scabra TaxID=79078 RepID=A0ABU6VG60_9FABA|nr:hypothetical protein [Stylosanthes scabra]
MGFNLHWISELFWKFFREDGFSRSVIIIDNRRFVLELFFQFSLPFFASSSKACCLAAMASALLIASDAIAASQVCLSKSSLRAASISWFTGRLTPFTGFAGNHRRRYLPPPVSEYLQSFVQKFDSSLFVV